MPRRSLKAHRDEFLALYQSGMSQKEIADKFDTRQSCIYKVLATADGYISRGNGQRKPRRGEDHHYWKADGVNYKAAHCRVVRHRGSPKICTSCGSENEQGKIYEWCSISGSFHDVNDYVRMCRQCHRKFDKNKRQEASAGLAKT